MTEMVSIRQDLLISSEKLFVALVENPALFQAMQGRFQNIQVLLLLRDPYDYIRSYYAQRVKTGDVSGSLDDYIIKNNFCVPHLERVVAFLNVAKVNGFQLTVHSYDRVRDALPTVVGEFLGIDPARFTLPPFEVVNRSLTRAELYLQSAFNSHFPNSKTAYRLVSYPLVTRLPTVKPEPPSASPAVYERLRELTEPKMEEANLLLPEGARYRRLSELTLEVSSGNDLSFSSAQLDVLAETLADAIRARRRSPQQAIYRLAGRLVRRVRSMTKL